MSFQYLDFYFRIIDSKTCYIGSDNLTVANAPVLGKSYEGPAIIPSIAIDSSTGKRYIVVATLRYSFRECANLKYVTLPDTLKKIEWDSFYKTSIESLFIPKSVERLGNSGLSNMNSLKSLVFEPGSKLSVIENWNFNSDSSLTTVIFPPSLKSIGRELFPKIETHIKLVYCGKNEISAKLLYKGNNITVYVTKQYRGSQFGDIDVTVMQDNGYSCAPYLTFYRPKYACKRKRENNSLNILLMVIIFSIC